MGMRHVRFGVYAHTAPDTLFVLDNANIPACPTYDPAFGPCTPYTVIRQAANDAALRLAIDECIGSHGRAITREELQDKCTQILGAIPEAQFEALLVQGQL